MGNRVMGNRVMGNRVMGNRVMGSPALSAAKPGWLWQWPRLPRVSLRSTPGYATRSTRIAPGLH
jgi:hypothetical protein